MGAKNEGQALAWRFVDLFVDEARAHLAGADEAVAAWRREPYDATAEVFRRHAHSLRGMARTLGLDTLVAGATRLENEGLGGLSADEVDAALVAIRSTVEAVARGERPGTGDPS